ncbi:PRKC apoptosis WT1 regulator protein isoform X4 [Malurus melanocephalus]|uniref:PRKC apoptosis WT1 regulator protein isoform X4 n=1 Tax=Malurus melanocephalus TaxID=175006 RepID=UPI002547D4A6|nr:PRKC apoptosis WT1 regulator protein isoform X4 [Malurus melanocephalus]
MGKGEGVREGLGPRRSFRNGGRRCRSPGAAVQCPSCGPAGREGVCASPSLSPRPRLSRPRRSRPTRRDLSSPGGSRAASGRAAATVLVGCSPRPVLREHGDRRLPQLRGQHHGLSGGMESQAGEDAGEAGTAGPGRAGRRGAASRGRWPRRRAEQQQPAPRTRGAPRRRGPELRQPRQRRPGPRRPRQGAAGGTRRGPGDRARHRTGLPRGRGEAGRQGKEHGPQRQEGEGADREEEAEGEEEVDRCGEHSGRRGLLQDGVKQV